MYRAVLDACVLVPSLQRDFLLQLASGSLCPHSPQVVVCEYIRACTQQLRVLWAEVVVCELFRPVRNNYADPGRTTVHYEAMNPAWNVAPHPHATPAEAPGNWRQHDIQPFPEGMAPPPFPEVDHRMADWVADVNTLRDESEIPFPERLAKIHNDFEKIHPYLDGNGRTGRLLLNLLLVRLGYPPAIVFKKERAKYLTAMRKADKSEYGPLGELVARAVTNNLYRFVVPAVAGPARLVPLASLVDPHRGITATGLRAAVERGRLRAQRTDTGIWLSSKNWVEEYQRSKHKRLKPTKGA